MSNDIAHYPLAPEVTRESVRSVSWTRRADHPLQDNTNLHVEIMPALDHQRWEGFGGAVSELGWQAIEALSPALRDELVQALFSEAGLNLQWIRLPVGSSTSTPSSRRMASTPRSGPGPSGASKVCRRTTA